MPQKKPVLNNSSLITEYYQSPKPKKIRKPKKIVCIPKELKDAKQSIVEINQLIRKAENKPLKQSEQYALYLKAKKILAKIDLQATTKYKKTAKEIISLTNQLADKLNTYETISIRTNEQEPKIILPTITAPEFEPHTGLDIVNEFSNKIANSTISLLKKPFLLLSMFGIINSALPNRSKEEMNKRAGNKDSNEIRGNKKSSNTNDDQKDVTDFKGDKNNFPKKHDSAQESLSLFNQHKKEIQPIKISQHNDGQQSASRLTDKEVNNILNKNVVVSLMTWDGNSINYDELSTNDPKVQKFKQEFMKAWSIARQEHGEYMDDVLLHYKLSIKLVPQADIQEVFKQNMRAVALESGLIFAADLHSIGYPGIIAHEMFHLWCYITQHCLSKSHNDAPRPTYPYYPYYPATEKQTINFIKAVKKGLKYIADMRKISQRERHGESIQPSQRKQLREFEKIVASNGLLERYAPMPAVEELRNLKDGEVFNVSLGEGENTYKIAVKKIKLIESNASSVVMVEIENKLDAVFMELDNIENNLLPHYSENERIAEYVPYLQQSFTRKFIEKVFPEMTKQLKETFAKMVKARAEEQEQTDALRIGSRNEL